MNSYKLILHLVLLGLFLACTDDDSYKKSSEDEGSSYLAVNIATTMPSRAFEDGDASESRVGNAIFFFFKPDGNSAYPAKQLALQFDNSTPADDNITSISQAVLVFSSKADAMMPTSMVVVLNPTAEINALTTPSLTDIQNILTTTYKNNSTDNNFVMSNAVYVGNNNTVINVTAIKPENIRPTQDAAMTAPVQAYVERLAAKVGVTFAATGQTSGVTAYPLGAFTIDGQAGVQVQLKNIKWDIVATNPKSNLLKKINPTWPTTPAPGFAWNDAGAFRSYWANSYKLSQNEVYGFKSFNMIGLTEANKAYCLENTNGATYTNTARDTAQTTKLIVSGTITDATGAVIDLMEWGGMKYTGTAMKTQIANLVQYYVNTGTTAAPVYTRITKDHITFTRTNATKQYHVRANVISGSYFTMNGNVATAVDIATVNNVLSNLGDIKHWNGGKAYYFIPIKHTNGEEAIIRNHVYKVTVNSITGLGTPIPVADEVIIPIKPLNDASYIAARINILAWTIVTQAVDLN
ncbi:MAG: Mfa1 family fimbria major subunit [Marinifilaceae bacterium]